MLSDLNLQSQYILYTSGTRAYGRDRTSLSQLKCKRIHPPNNTHNIMIIIMYQRDILYAVMGERARISAGVIVLLGG